MKWLVGTIWADVTQPGNLVVALYRDSFDPENPGLNRVGVFDQGEPLQLDSGQEYRVVVQHWCSNIFPAAFAVSIAGPGDIGGSDVVVSPDWSLGQLDGSEPMVMFSGASQKYDVSGPVIASATGNHWFADVSVFDRLDLVIRVYQGAFDPVDTTAGLVARLDDFGDLLLEAGKTYQFVVTAYIPGNTGGMALGPVPARSAWVQRRSERRMVQPGNGWTRHTVGHFH